MPEEIAFGKRRKDARHAPLRLDGSFVVAALISLLLVVPAVVVGWSVGKAGGAAGFAMAVAAGSVASVIITFLAAGAWLRFGPGDRLFADATLTGWVRRGRAERRVAAARQVFDNPDVASIELHVDRLIAISRAVEARHCKAVACWDAKTVCMRAGSASAGGVVEVVVFLGELMLFPRSSKLLSVP